MCSLQVDIQPTAANAVNPNFPFTVEVDEWVNKVAQK